MSTSFVVGLLVAVVLLVFGAGAATALSIVVAPHETACAYIDVPVARDRISFIFAVRSGGSFDIDYTVKDPKDLVIYSGEKERQNEVMFNADVEGEYSFCFSNKMSTFAEKLIYFDIALASEKKGPLSLKGASKNDNSDNDMEASLSRLKNSLGNIERLQRFYGTRERRNMETASSTENVLFWFTATECVLIIAMACFQVYVIRHFFAEKKGRSI